MLSIRSTDPNHPDGARALNEMISGKAKRIRDVIQARIRHVCVRSGGHSVRSSCKKNRPHLAKWQKKWLPEFWTSAIEVAKGNSAGIILKCNADCLRITANWKRKRGITKSQSSWLRISPQTCGQKSGGDVWLVVVSSENY
eukprot:m.28762 g.28762  ORF g.28762 m.28762 type:complete len:141 (+) comp31015_c0_seq1:669-1091(+)